MVFQPKSQPAPDCLAAEQTKATGTYHCGDVLVRLKADFKNKCYLCEEREPSSINIEHFVPHRGDVALKFAWDNLFYCCGHCNNTKLAKAAYDELLNCTKAEDAVDTQIRYRIRPMPREKAEITGLSEESKVQNTVKLLDEIYNGTTTLKTVEAGNLRAKLLKEVREFYDLLFEYNDALGTDEEIASAKARIERQLRSGSAFTAFKRWIVRDSVFAADFSSDN